ncbi:hypothetical protein DH2020_007860 [Rehmannia glutinosa]|uniref:Kinesin motor domain-containing protein n=1 Tax=Rehmannia glutinosa TaxID=99300 RepID=A0ABR0TZV5_REHGL
MVLNKFQRRKFQQSPATLPPTMWLATADKSVSWSHLSIPKHRPIQNSHSYFHFGTLRAAKKQPARDSQMSSTSATRRSSVSPFRSRKTPPPPPSFSTRPATPSSSSSSSTTLLSKQPAPLPPTTPPGKAKENVTVTVRFRPLSAREISKGDEVAWYADGDYTVRNEFNSDIGYGFGKKSLETERIHGKPDQDINRSETSVASENMETEYRVFGPATTTRHVYDVAAHHVVSGAMEGINGTVFAYGVTSSGKTHTMHGEQKSPGIIPLAVKDVFGIIQETPGREFLLRVSYLEIYNEVINDLLDPTGQNLRIREDSQGTYVEGIKEEVVLSPAHALSLIASGEEHRHVGSNNFNLLSSRSHTIFTLTIESSPCGENDGEEVTLSQLHLIDLAGSESSKTETTGLRRKEGSYINKSLLTLGTVISKLTDEKSTHIPYRDSKLTRLLQSSLSGHGRVSLICTVTPASSNTEESHNTLKFAQRSKHVEIKASQNKLEAGQIKLQSRLEEEEQAKAALMGRIQRLTKLILVSTKTTIQPSVVEKPSHRRRHSFGEDELAYLPDRKRESMIDDDAGSIDSEVSMDGRSDATNLDELVRDYKRNKRRGMLGWFKLKKPENGIASSSSADNESSASGSPASSSKSSQRRVMFSDMKDASRKSVSRKVDDVPPADSFPERTQAGDLISAAVGVRRLPPTGSTITDQMDLFREQIKMLAGEVALSTSSLKRLSEQAAKSGDSKLQENIQKLKDEIREKKLQMRVLEQRMIGSVEISPYGSSIVEMSQALSRLATQLNEKTFELEIKSADNRVLQEQLRGKDEQLEESLEIINGRGSEINSCEEISLDENTPTSVGSLNRTFNHEDVKEFNRDAFSTSQLLVQAAEIESLKQDKVRLIEEKDGLEIHCQKQTEEASYAKELAAAAAVELRNLAAENEDRLSMEEVELELSARYQREASLVAALSERDKIEADLRKRLDDAKRHEEKLENELANMRDLIVGHDISNVSETKYLNGYELSDGQLMTNFYNNEESESVEKVYSVEERNACYQSERKKSKELKGSHLRLKKSAQNVYKVEKVTSIFYWKKD